MEVSRGTTVAEKLVILREQAGLSQEDVADAVHVSRQSVSKWEVGKALPSTDSLKLLCQLFQVSADYLLSDESPEPPCCQTEQPGTPPGPDAQEEAPATKHKMPSPFWIGILAGILLCAITACLWNLWPKDAPEEEIIPLENVPVDTKEGAYPTVTFSFDSEK